MPKKIDWDNLTFSLTPAKTMFVSQCGPDGQWDKGKYLPFKNISISPAAGVLNYGQGLFEGLKALRTQKGEIVLFRPVENGKRLAEGARRLCMPEYPPERFVEAVRALVKKNAAFVPPYGKGSLYVRPCLWGTGPVLGVSPAPGYTFLTYVSPVGAYFKTGLKPIKLVITSAYHRSASKGTGGVKSIGNYAPTMYPAKEAKAQGYSECIYLDSREERYIEEVGAANFFCVKGNVLATPALGSILPGITRKSVMQLASDLLKMDVQEKYVSVEEALDADEAFCTGTAAVVSSIGSITFQGREKVYGAFSVGPVTRKLYDLLTKIQLTEEEDRFGWVEKVK